MVHSLIPTWATWGERRREADLDEGPADQLMEITSSLSNHARRITQIRNQAARHTPPAAAPGKTVPPPAPSPAQSARRR
ncbi:hypothetical protein [Streptomyces globisporus]|uniref:hypothetical protein n=1 Tax=Streptomyces globisporus TaxID=1908 RepID=UPI003789019A